MLEQKVIDLRRSSKPTNRGGIMSALTLKETKRQRLSQLAYQWQVVHRNPASPLEAGIFSTKQWKEDKRQFLLAVQTVANIAITWNPKAVISKYNVELFLGASHDKASRQTEKGLREMFREMGHHGRIRLNPHERRFIVDSARTFKLVNEGEASISDLCRKIINPPPETAAERAYNSGTDTPMMYLKHAWSKKTNRRHPVAQDLRDWVSIERLKSLWAFNADFQLAVEFTGIERLPECSLALMTEAVKERKEQFESEGQKGKLPLSPDVYELMLSACKRLTLLPSE